MVPRPRPSRRVPRLRRPPRQQANPPGAVFKGAGNPKINQGLRKPDSKSEVTYKKLTRVYANQSLTCFLE